jgi:hypothetical protein
MSNDDDKKKTHCPGCSRPHIESFEQMHRAWQSLTQAAGSPIVRGFIIHDAMQQVINDTENGSTVALVMLRHAALAEFYFSILRTDIGALKLTQTEREQLETLLEDFHTKGLDLADDLQEARVAILQGEEAANEAQPEPETTEADDVLAVLAKYGLLRAVEGGEA